MRAERSAKNLLYGLVSQTALILMAFVVRLALVRTLGILSVSLNGLFTEIISMLSLAELGVGSAIIYSLYKPLAERDEERLAKLMNLFKNAYRIIACAIMGLGLLLMPFIQYLVTKVEIDLGYLRLIYFLFLFQTASSYLFSYKSALFNADQNLYVVSYITCAAKLVFDAVNIALLILFQNYLLFLLVNIASTLLINILISRKADQTYPFLKRKDTLRKEERRPIYINMRNLFIGNISGKITNSTDNILISTLVNTVEVGVFTGYSMIATALRRVVDQLDFATAGSIGNLMTEGRMEKCDDILHKLTFINYYMGSFFACGLYAIASSLLRMVYGPEYAYDNTNIFGLLVIFMFSVNFLLTTLRTPLWQMMRVSGLFAKDKNISILGCAVNLIISVVFGIRWGTLGIILGTTATLGIQILLKIRLLYRECFRRKSRYFYGKFFLYCGISILLMLCVKYLAYLVSTGNQLLDLAGKCLIAGVIPPVINHLCFRKTVEYRYTWDLVFSRVFRLINHLRRAKGKPPRSYTPRLADPNTLSVHAGTAHSTWQDWE